MLTKETLDDELRKIHDGPLEGQVRLAALLNRAELAGLLTSQEGTSAEEHAALQADLAAAREAIRGAFDHLNAVDESILARTDAPTQQHFRDALRLLRGRWTA